MRYYLGPWTWLMDSDGGYWSAPTGSQAAVDLRTYADKALAGALGTRPLGFFAVPDGEPALSSDYALLGIGDVREISATVAMQDTWQALMGFRPAGITLIDLLADQLTAGADPEGLDAPPPLMPTNQGILEIRLAGHSQVWRFKHHWGDVYTNRIAARLHHDFRLLRAANAAEAAEWRSLSSAMASRTWSQIVSSNVPVLVRHRPKLVRLRAHGLTVAQARARFDNLAVRLDGHERRYLDSLRLKFRLPSDQWRDLLPAEWRGDHPGPLPHETTLTESFNTADGDTLGPDLTWTETKNDSDIVSNKASVVTSGGGVSSSVSARCEADLSTDDHYCQATITGTGTAASAGPAVRFNSSANNYYGGGCRTNVRQIASISAGSQTNLASDTTGIANGSVVRLEVNGSSLELFDDAVSVLTATDTGFSGQTRCGICGKESGMLDVWEAGDLAAAGGQPTMRRWGGIPGMAGAGVIGGSW